MSPSDATERFSNRVADYVRYRPGYPPALLDWLHHDMGVPTETLVADIGAGTGISTRLFLAAGHPVIAVEPNAAMRNAADAWLSPYHLRLKLVDGTAEATTLADDSVGLVSAAQAFHWFDMEAVRAEWRRILHPGGQALVFWNSRLLDSSPFLIGYEQLLLEFGTDYTEVAERYQDDATMKAWFGSGFRAMASFPQRAAHGCRRPAWPAAFFLVRTAAGASASCADAGGPATAVRRTRGRRSHCLRVSNPCLHRHAGLTGPYVFACPSPALLA